MPRQQRPRRHQPRDQCISESVIREEAHRLLREIDDVLIMSTNAIRSDRTTGATRRYPLFGIVWI